MSFTDERRIFHVCWLVSIIGSQDKKSDRFPKLLKLKGVWWPLELVFNFCNDVLPLAHFMLTRKGDNLKNWWITVLLLNIKICISFFSSLFSLNVHASCTDMVQGSNPYCYFWFNLMLVTWAQQISDMLMHCKLDVWDMSNKSVERSFQHAQI